MLGWVCRVWLGGGRVMGWVGGVGEGLRGGYGVVKGLIAALLVPVIHGDMVAEGVLGGVSLFAIGTHEHLGDGRVQVSNVCVEIGLGGVGLEAMGTLVWFVAML